MNKLIAQWLDLYAVAEKNKHHSATSQYRLNPMERPVDKEIFYAAPPLPEIEFDREKNHQQCTIGRFRYESQIKDNLDSNCKVHGLYYTNDQSKTHVIVVHGWRSSNWNHPKELLLEPLLGQNHNLYFMELPHHFSRCSPTSVTNHIY